MCALLPPTAFCTTERFPSVSRLSVRKLPCFHDLATAEKTWWLDRELYAEPPLRFVSDTKFRVLTFSAVFFVLRQTRTCLAPLPPIPAGGCCEFQRKRNTPPKQTSLSKVILLAWRFALCRMTLCFNAIACTVIVLPVQSRAISCAPFPIAGVHNLRLHVAFDENVRGRTLVIYNIRCGDRASLKNSLSAL